MEKEKGAKGISLFIRQNKIPIFIFVILIAGLVAYSNIYKNQFLWDDEFMMQRNTFLQSFSNIPKIFTVSSSGGSGHLDNLYRPMQVVSYLFTFQIGGLNPLPFHILNILIHLSNAVLIFFLIKKIFKKDILAFFTSLLWVVHPIHTEAVTYMSGTPDPLITFFALMSFILYIKFRESSKLHYILLSALSFVFALFSKETIVIFPGLLVIYEFINAEKRFSFKNLKSHLKNYYCTFIFLGISIIYFIMRLTVLKFGDTLNFYTTANVYSSSLYFRILTFMASLLAYYYLLFFPANLHMERNFPIFIDFFNWQIFLSLAILLALGFILYTYLRKSEITQAGKIITFGILWFFISFIPMSGIIPVNSILLEHWLYFPSIGFFLLVAFLLTLLFENKKYRTLSISLVVVIVIILLSITLARNKDWNNPVDFYNSILKYEEGTARVHNNLANAYSDQGIYQLAEKHYLIAIQMTDTYPQPHYNLANLYLKKGDVSSAIAQLQRSIELDPNFFYSYNLLGQIYQHEGNETLAQEYFDKAKSITYYTG